MSIRAGLVWLAGGRRHCGRWAGARGLLGWCGVTLEGNIIIMACGFYAFSLAALIRRALAEVLSLDSWLHVGRFLYILILTVLRFTFYDKSSRLIK